MRRGSDGADARGGTLLEVLVAVSIFTIVLFAVYSIFEASGFTYNRGAAKADIQLNARNALDRMVTEVKLAGYGLPKATFPSALTKITQAAQSTITFRANINNVSTTVSPLAETTAGGTVAVNVASSNGLAVGDTIYLSDASTWLPITVTLVNPALIQGSAPTASSHTYPVGSTVVQYRTIAYALNGTTLTRDEGTGAIPVAQLVQALTFTYYDANANIVAAPVPAANLGGIRRIAISLRASASPARQDPQAYTVTADIWPRN